MNLVITGATGYVGRRLVSMALKRDYQVLAASRRRPDSFGAEWIQFDLSSTVPITLPAHTHAVVHLAANTSSMTDEEGEREVLSASLLISAAQKTAAKFVFVSSQTARADAPTAYGRIKWQIEQLVLSAGGWVVRPGQVYGGAPQGLFGTIVRTVRYLPLLPAFLPAPHVQPIHVDDLSNSLLKLIERDDIPPSVLCLAAPEPESFTSFLSAVASARVRRKRYFVPMPILIVKVVAILIGSRLKRQTGLDRLNSLFDLPPMNSTDDLRLLGVALRSLSSGMHPSGDDRRRFLIREAQALLTYVLRERPHSDLVRRYVRAIEKLRSGFPLGLPEWTLRWTATLALLDDRKFALSEGGKEFAWRIDAATALAEATPEGARRFLGRGKSSSVLTSILNIARAVFAEVLWRVLRLLYLLLIHGLTRHSRGPR